MLRASSIPITDLESRFNIVLHENTHRASWDGSTTSGEVSYRSPLSLEYSDIYLAADSLWFKFRLSERDTASLSATR